MKDLEKLSNKLLRKILKLPSLTELNIMS